MTIPDDPAGQAPTPPPDGAAILPPPGFGAVEPGAAPVPPAPRTEPARTEPVAQTEPAAAIVAAAGPPLPPSSVLGPLDRAGPPPVPPASRTEPLWPGVAAASPPAFGTVPPPNPPAPDGAGDPPQPPPAPLTRRQRFRSWRFAPVIEVLATIALALVLAEGVQAAVVKPFVIPSPSMEPTLIPSQRVLVNRLAYDFGSPHRGDIVVFHPPSSQACAISVSADKPCPQSVSTPASDYYVKRIMGLPGDRLSIRGGHPVINGRQLKHEPYIDPCGGAPECNMPQTITIPKGEYFMMGDNRGDSDDSRFWGPVPASWIIGQVFATYWPPDRIGVF